MQPRRAQLAFAALLGGALIVGLCALLTQDLAPQAHSAAEHAVAPPSAESVPPAARTKRPRRGPRRLSEPSAAREVDSTATDDGGAAQVLVHDACGRPVLGAELRSEHLEDDAGWTRFTGDDGLAVRPAEDPARTVVISATGFASATLDCRAGAGRDSIILVGNSILVGRVVEQDGRSAGIVDVRATCPNAAGKHRGGHAWATRSGPDGSFRIAQLPPGPITVSARMNATATVRARTATLAVTLPHHAEVELRLHRAHEVRGRITDALGDLPPGSLSLVMRGIRPNGDNGEVWTAEIAEDGTFVLNGVSSATNVLWAWTDDAESGLALTTLHDTEPGTGELQVRLAPGGVISGRLIDDQGDAVEGQSWFYALEGGRVVNGGTTKADGAFRTYLLPSERRYDVILSSQSGWTGAARGVAPGSSDIVIAGRRLPPLTGRVVRSDGTPVEEPIHVRAIAESVGVRSRPGAAVDVRTDADGRFSFDGLAEFEFVLSASESPRWMGATRHPGTARPGDDLTITLLEPRSVVAQVIDLHGAPAPGRTIWVVPVDDAQSAEQVQSSPKGQIQTRLATRGRVRFVLYEHGERLDLGEWELPVEDVELVVPLR